MLARDPEEIRLSEIVSAVDGPITLGDFGQPHQDGACDHEGQCVLIAVWNEAGEYMRRHLDSYTLAAVARMARGDAPWPVTPVPDVEPVAATLTLAPIRVLEVIRVLAVEESRAPTLRCPQTLGWRVASHVARSSGSGLVKVRRSPVVGWSKDSSAAWRNGRVRPSVVRRSP